MLSGDYPSSVEILSTSNNGTSFKYSSHFGSAGSGNGQFTMVGGVALDIHETVAFRLNAGAIYMCYSAQIERDWRKYLRPVVSPIAA